MQKFTRKIMSFFLVIMFIFTIMPIVSFAAEEAEVCATCNHQYTVTLGSVCQPFSEAYHKVCEASIYTCDHCHAVSYTLTGDYYLERHENVQIGTDYEGCGEYYPNHLVIAMMQCTICAYTQRVDLKVELCRH